jgi:Flp pilus assembly protein TadD
VVANQRTLAQLEGMTLAQAYALADFGHNLMQHGRPQPALTIFESLTISVPRHAFFHALVGIALQRLGQADLALLAYERALECDPAETAALVNRAELLIRRGECEQARCDLQKALELDPTSERPETRRARALLGSR